MAQNKIKKGDACVVINCTSDQLYETKILSAGSKWIYVERFYKEIKFNTTNLHSDLGNYTLFIGTIEEYKEYVSLEKEKIKLTEEIISLIGNLNIENLKELKNFVKTLTFQIGDVY